MINSLTSCFFLALIVLVGSLALPDSYDVQRVGALFVLALILFDLLSGSTISSKQDIKYSLLLAIVILLGVLFSGATWFSLMVGSFLFSVVVIMASRQPVVSSQHSIAAIWLLALMSAVLIFTTIGLQIVSLIDLGELDRSLVPGFNNQRHFNQIQAIVTPLLIGAGLITPLERRHRLFLLLLGFISLGLMFITRGRGVVLAFVIAAIFVALLSGYFRKRILLGCFVLLVFAFLTTLGVDSWLEGALLDRYTDTRTSGRIELWLESLRLAVEYFPLGVGGGLFPMVNESGYRVAHPHNTFFWILSEWGIFALLAVGMIITRTFIRLYKAFDPSNSHHVIVCFALISSCVYSLFGGLALMPMSSLLFVLLFVWANGLAANRPEQTSVAAPPARWIASVYRITVLLTAIVLISTAVLRITLLEDLLAYRGSGPIWPGFWLNGRFWDNIP